MLSGDPVVALTPLVSSTPYVVAGQTTLRSNIPRYHRVGKQEQESIPAAYRGLAQCIKTGDDARCWNRFHVGIMAVWRLASRLLTGLHKMCLPARVVGKNTR